MLIQYLNALKFRLDLRLRKPETTYIIWKKIEDINSKLLEAKSFSPVSSNFNMLDETNLKLIQFGNCHDLEIYLVWDLQAKKTFLERTKKKFQS